MRAVRRLQILFRKNTWLPAALCIGLTAVLFQNCSKVNFGQASDSLDSSSTSGDSQTVYVDFNTPKAFNAQFSSQVVSGMSIVLSNGSTTMALPSGATLSVTDAATQQLTYTPANGFRASETTPVILKDNYGHQVADNVTFIVASAIREIQPAMATRTNGCITCHAQVSSKYITDFGAGDSYFFGQGQTWVFDNTPNGFYSDRYNDMSWLTSTFSGGIIVPSVAFNFDIGAQIQHYVNAGGMSNPTVAQQAASQLKSTSHIADYLKIMENAKPVSDAGNIQEMSQVYIGAPTAATLLTRTALGSQTLRYVKNSPSSPDLSGFTTMTASDGSAYYQATNLTCDGDLIVSSPVFLKNLVLTTDQGCRIYTTKSVFVNGAITYASVSSNSLPNLQLESSEWINMGVGLTHCESASNPGWYVSNPNHPNPAQFRMVNYGAPTRAHEDASAQATANQSLVAEESLISGFIDASCGGGSSPRAISFDHLFLNAPRVDSRYTGHFTGVTVAEVTLFGLSTFAYTYDPVFTNVPVLPFLQAADYLTVVQ